ncbi:zinc/iron-chelating domain-containing protein [Deinococcus irradiatisoli]|uniref:Zinc/iron-chelating domain-containing protein n=1 Tax=Deinococcus irradiatisoli TaxID=2202254 RepID=A0A2Z3JCY9_9DEIO|nr:YkgJ family cysteine cluster protein [Deinococcus irradiatisoli]AWN23037.1 zinc/iron-chelating domain-containing protein [Deinococcus irradiatisoli]
MTAPTAVLSTVKAAYARYEQRAGQFLREYTASGGQVYCGAGCFGCCNMPIRLSLAEAALIASVLTPEEAHKVDKHARKVVHNARTAPSEDEYVHRHRLKVGYCPLLGADGACTRYDVRPTRCRDTFSAFPAVYCQEGTWESMTKAERRDYQREVRRTPGTDGETHFIAPLEELSEPVWNACSRAMRQAWGLEAWGDFWVLTTLAARSGFMAAVERGDKGAALREARQAGLEHPALLEFA